VLLLLAACPGQPAPGPVPPLSAGPRACAQVRCAEGTCNDTASGVPFCMAALQDPSGRPTQPTHVGLPEQVPPLFTGGVVEGVLPEGSGTGVVVRSFEARAGHWYHFALRCSSQPLCTALFLDATGRIVLGARVQDPDSPFQAPSGLPLMKAEAAGRHLVMLLVEPTPRGNTYTGRLEDWGADDHGDTPASASPVSAPPGGEASFRGLLDPSEDVDAFAVPALGRGEALRVRCEGGEGHPAPGVRLRGPDGALLDPLVPEPGGGLHLTREAGTHTVAVRVLRQEGVRDAPYRCALRRVAPDVDEAWGTAAALEVPGEVEGWTSDAADVDAYRARLQAGLYYVLGCSASGTACTGTVRSASGAPLGSFSDLAPLTLKRLAPEEVLLAVRTDRPAAFRLSATVGGVDDHGDTAASATPLPASAPGVRAQFERPADVDVLALTATAAGQVLRLACTSAFPFSSSAPLGVSLQDAQGAVVDADSAGYGESAVRVAVEAPAPGRYTAALSVESPAGRTDWTRHAVDCHLEVLAGDDAPDAADAADAPDAGPPVPLPARAAGLLEWRGDVDALAFHAPAGALVRAASTAPHRLRVRDASGGVVPQSLEPAALGFKAPAAGTYVLEVSAQEAWTPQTERYEVALEDLGPDDHGDTPETASPLAPDSPEAGQAQGPADVDLFAAPLAVQGIYLLSLTPGDGASVALSASAASGSLDAAPQPRGPDGAERLRVDPHADGDVRVAVVGTGRYTLRLEQVGTDDVPDADAQAAALTAGVERAGVLESRTDTDVFRLALEPGRVYQRTLVSGRPLRVDLRADTFLTFHSATSFSASAPGTAFLRVLHATPPDAPPTAYRLRVD
jgi:hypothetical protein